MINPRYIADFGGGKFHVYDRIDDKLIPYIGFNEFITLEWMPVGKEGSIAGEAAHFGAVSSWSKAQPFKDEKSIRDFYSVCAVRGVVFRLLPHRDIYKYRQQYMTNNETVSKSNGKKGKVFRTEYTFPSNGKVVIAEEPVNGKKTSAKSDEVDLLTWHEVIQSDENNIWEVAKRVENQKFYDTKKPIDDRLEENPDCVFLLGMKMRELQKIPALIISKSDDDDKYWNSKPGQFSIECLTVIYDRLSNHNSDSGNVGVKIENGVSQTTIGGKPPITIRLAEDVLGFTKSKNKTSFGGSGFIKTGLKHTQIVSCAMALMDQEGDRYENPFTKKPYGFKMIKQFGMTSTALHGKPGFSRPKLYHDGIKHVFKRYLEKYDGSEYMDRTNPEHRQLLKFVRNTCRIAYELTVKSMIQSLNGVNVPLGVEKFAA